MTARDRAAARAIRELTRTICELAVEQKDTTQLIELAKVLRWPPSEPAAENSP